MNRERVLYRGSTVSISEDNSLIAVHLLLLSNLSLLFLHPMTVFSHLSSLRIYRVPFYAPFNRDFLVANVYDQIVNKLR